MVEAGVRQVAGDDDVGPVTAAYHVQRVAVVLEEIKIHLFIFSSFLTTTS